MLFFSVKEIGGGAYVLLFILFISFLALIFYLYRYRVCGYILSGDTLVVKRSLGSCLSFLLADVIAADAIRSPFPRSVRLNGNWGGYGFYGEFKQIGGPHFTAYVTDTRNCIVLRIKGFGLIVFSPYERDRFLDVLAKLRPDLPIRRTVGTLQEFAQS